MGFPVNEWFDWGCKERRRRLKEALRREGYGGGRGAQKKVSGSHSAKEEDVQ
jgi:hypothetical protein